MRGWIAILLVAILSVSAYAALCTDTDNGGSKTNDEALKVLGEVKYGIQKEKDVCLTSEDGVSTNKSKYLKEFFCSPEDKRESKVYDCVKLGFEGCENGICKGQVSAAQQQQQVNPCGNKILEKDKGEECDPPNSICFGKTTAEYGICESNCKCRISTAAKANLENLPAFCGDSIKHKDEECEEDKDCPTSYVCSSCKCVKMLTQAEIEAMKQAAQQEKTGEVSKEIDEKYKTPELPKVNLTGENFNETAGLKATSGIANFFRKIFGWIAALFS